MPYGDGTGPLGLGPGTGWGRGPYGRGVRRLRGRYCQRRWGYYPNSKEDEVSALQEEQKILEEELQAVKSRIDGIKK